MPPYAERTYRGKINAAGLFSFRVVVKETDLWVSTERNLEKETRDLVLDCRHQIESHIETHAEFATSLQPLSSNPFAPRIVQKMIDATSRVNVGPMASVAGAVAQYVGEGLLAFSDQVIVENGGDIFMKTNRPATVSIFAGPSPLSEKIGLAIPLKQMPLGICSSSAKVGHSLSRGITDVCCILSPSAVFADGAATALGNRVKSKKDLEWVAQWAGLIDGIMGGVVIIDDRIAAWGDIELVEL